jgi:hypothetical protein
MLGSGVIGASRVAVGDGPLRRKWLPDVGSDYTGAGQGSGHTRDYWLPWRETALRDVVDLQFISIEDASCGSAQGRCANTDPER